MRWVPVLERLPRVARTYAIAALAGYAAMRLHVPLPWMMGALLATAAQALSPWEPALLGAGRRAGQLIVGISVGLAFTAEAAAATASHFTAMTAAAVLTLAAGAAISLLFARLARVDRLTAVMSSVPGGPADMAILAERYGGDPLAVALAQTFRIALIVLVIPPAMILSGIDGHAEVLHAPLPFDPLGLAGLTLGSLAAVVGLIRLGLANAWLLGAVLVVGGLTAAGVEWSGMPAGFVSAAQVLLGSSLGITFNRRFLARSHRLLFAALFCAVLLLAACSALAIGLSHLAHLPPAALLVSLAPGGLTEMVLTARVLHLGVPMVTAFHLERIILTLLLAPHLVAAVAWLTRRRAQPAPGFGAAD